MKNKKIICLITALSLMLPVCTFAEETESVDAGSLLADAVGEQRDVFANIISNSVMEVMENTVMIQPEAAYGYVFGRKTAVGNDDSVKVYTDGRDIYAPAEFLKEAFPKSSTGSNGFCNVREFADNNGLNVKTVNNTTYISKDYTIPGNLPATIGKFFGIYVSAGNKGSGTFENPLSSIIDAKKMISEIKKTIGLPDGGITVYIREGTYPITDTVNFLADDGGADGSPIIYKVYNDEKVSFSGGINVEGSEFKDVTDKKILARLPDADNVVCVDLSSRLSGFTDSFKNSDPAHWALSYRDEPLSICRWPDKTFALTTEILESSKDWRAEGFRIVVDDVRMKRWAGEEDPRIFGYFCYRWAGEFRRIAEVRASDMSIKSDRGAEYGILAGKEYYVYNLVSELDSPGEYYFDKKTNMLYLYPVEGDKTSKTFLENEVQFALLSQVMFNMKDCSNVVFDGITFENSLGTIFDMAETCRSITYKGCTFKNIANGICQRGYDNTITGCDFYNITANPVSMNGGDRTTLTPSGSVLINCRFRNFNTVSRTNCGAIQLKGCGDTVSHNEIVGGPHTAVTLSGNDNIIEYNEFYDNMKDNAEDAGPIYGGRDLSSQMNIIRYNYFHDIYPSIGVIYFDDVLSNQHAVDNVFINTTRSVFVHGGVSNTVERNLVINSAFDGAAVRTNGQSANMWITSNAGSEATNVFMYRLLQFPYKSKPWQKYSDVFRHIDAYKDAVVIPPYDCEFTDNIIVNPARTDGVTQGMEAIGENVAPYVTIENNKVITGEAAENFVIPDNYQKIIDEAGIYVDEDRKTLDTLGSFDLVRPYNREDNVEGSEVEFEWSEAENASRYLFTLSTDNAFNNIISNKYVSSNHVTIEKLNYFNTRYYWRVTAVPKKTNSMLSEERVSSNQEYFSFTTKAFEKINTAKLDDLIDVCRSKTVQVVEGDNPGEYKAGTLEMINTLLETYEKQAASSTVTQREINEMVTTLKSEFNMLINRRNTDYCNMKELLSSSKNWSITPNQFISTEGYLKHTTKSSNMFGTAEKLPAHQIVKFNAVFSNVGNSWIGLAIRAQASPTAVAWSGNNQYLIIIKSDTIEFQKWGGESVLIEYPNTYVKPGEKHEYEFAAENQDDGSVIVTFKIDGETITEYHDTDNPLTDPGFFEVYGGGQDTCVEIMAE